MSETATKKDWRKGPSGGDYEMCGADGNGIDRLPVEPVDVIPASSVADLQAERDELRAERDEWKARALHAERVLIPSELRVRADAAESLVAKAVEHFTAEADQLMQRSDVLAGSEDRSDWVKASELAGVAAGLHSAANHLRGKAGQS